MSSDAFLTLHADVGVFAHLSLLPTRRFSESLPLRGFPWPSQGGMDSWEIDAVLSAQHLAEHHGIRGTTWTYLVVFADAQVVNLHGTIPIAIR